MRNRAKHIVGLILAFLGFLLQKRTVLIGFLDLKFFLSPLMRMCFESRIVMARMLLEAFVEFLT